MAVDKRFGERVAQERRRKSVADRRDILKKDLARALDVSESTVGRWEQGTVPDDPTLERLAAYFGVTVPWLRYEAGERESGHAEPTGSQRAAAVERPDVPAPRVSAKKQRRDDRKRA